MNGEYNGGRDYEKRTMQKQEKMEEKEAVCRTVPKARLLQSPNSMHREPTSAITYDFRQARRSA